MGFSGWCNNRIFSNILKRSTYEGNNRICFRGVVYVYYSMDLELIFMPYKDKNDPRKKENNRKRQQKWRDRKKEKSKLVDD